MFFSQIFSGSGNLLPAGSGGWLGSALAVGGRTDAGVSINPQTALAITSVQRAVTLLAESIAQLPCRLYQRQSSGDRREVVDHSASGVIGARPNGWMTAYQAHEYKQFCMGLRGNAFALKDIAADGTVQSLYPLHPDRVQILVSPVDRMPYYRVLLAPDGIAGVFPLRLMHHVRWVGDNPYAGLSPIALHREALGTVAAAERHAARVFGAGTRLSGVLTRPAAAPALKDQADVDRLLDAWEKKYGGSDHTGRVALLQEGMEFKPLSMSNEDAQLIEARGYGVRDVARIYGIPPHKLGDLSDATLTNIEQQSLEFVVYTMMPWIKRHEEAMERDLLTANDRAEGLYIQFDATGLLRGDTQSRYAAYAQARQWGWLSVNDIRRLENLPPIVGGDTYLQPLNMADGKTGLPIGKPGSSPGKPTVQHDGPTAQQVRAVTQILEV